MLVADEPTFAERLKALREAAGMNQAALAKASGVSFQAISKFERGDREPSWGIVRKLARALSVSLGDFDDAAPLPPAITELEAVPAGQPETPELPEVLPEPGHVPKGKYK